MLLNDYGIFKEKNLYNFKLLGLIFHGVTFGRKGENGSSE